jgi:hypothetical protein
MAANLAEEFLTKNNSVKFGRLHWVDYSGVLLTRIITKARCLRLAQGAHCYHLDQYCMNLDLHCFRCFYKTLVFPHQKISKVGLGDPRSAVYMIANGLYLPIYKSRVLPFSYKNKPTSYLWIDKAVSA